MITPSTTATRPIVSIQPTFDSETIERSDSTAAEESRDNDAFNIQTLSHWFLQSIRAGGWAPLVVFGFHAVVVLGWNAYHKVQNLDIPMHIIGGVAIAYFFWKSIHTPSGRALLGSQTLFARALLTLTATGATTGLWEFAEWTTDSLGWTRAQGDVHDTMLDMFLGMLGGLLLVIQFARSKRK